MKKWGGSIEDEDFDAADPASGDDIAEIDSAIDTEIRMRDVRAAMAELSDREQHVIKRLELDGATRDEVATELGVTPPRISQIRKAALERPTEKILSALQTIAARGVDDVDPTETVIQSELVFEVGFEHPVDMPPRESDSMDTGDGVERDACASPEVRGSQGGATPTKTANTGGVDRGAGVLTER